MHTMYVDVQLRKYTARVLDYGLRKHNLKLTSIYKFTTDVIRNIIILHVVACTALIQNS